AIDRFTGATFQNKNGDNLVIVGQKEEMAIGMLRAALLTLLAQNRLINSTKRPFCFYILDGQSALPAKNSSFGDFCHALGSLIHLGSKLELSDFIKRIHQETLRRQQSSEESHEDWFLILHGLHRFRNLFREEDEFGISGQASSDDNPSSMLSFIIKEGPSLGIHSLIWCDTLANLQRVFNRQSMRELTMRVAMQMNVNDSSQLIDSPAASKLGPNRALFSNEEEGVLEKFRPYGIVSREQIQQVAEFLSLS
ncbi:MAG: cell division protein FtsK, partial [Gemmataceae bacterium]